jgi:hypothetical protein
MIIKIFIGLQRFVRLQALLVKRMITQFHQVMENVYQIEVGQNSVLT